MLYRLVGEYGHICLGTDLRDYLSFLPYSYPLTNSDFEFLIPDVLYELQPFTTELRVLTTMRKKPFKNIVKKTENAGNQHFLLFSRCFLAYLKLKSSFQLHLVFSV